MSETPSELVLALFGVQQSKVAAFAALLEAEGSIRGLIGPRETDRIWSRHIVNSAAVLPFLPRSGSVADVGYGAGLPGMVIACARPDLQVFLIEPMERRCEWLRYASGELGLTNVTVIRDRAENLDKNFKVNAVTARAVRKLSQLVELTAPLLDKQGCLLALKGQRAGQEVREAHRELNKFKLTPRVHEVVSVMDGEVTYVVECCRK